MATLYHSRAAQEAEAMNIGDESYRDYLERHAHDLAAHYARKGNARKAVEMLTRSLSSSLAGNDGA